METSKLNQPKISILIPAKNVDPFISECLNSIINQTYSNWELIVVDDSSTDKTYSILKDFEQQDKRIKIYKNKGVGIITALQLAYSKSSGEFITRMDSDDIMLPNKLELLYNNLKEKGRGHIAIGQVEYFALGGVGEGYLKYQNWLNQLTEQGENYTDIYKECVIPSPCWMIHKSDFNTCGAFNSNIYPEDYDLCFRFYRHNLKVIPCNEIVHKWRDYETRTSRTDSNYTNNTFIHLKCKYFVELDYNLNRELILLGAGKKGKKIATYLTKFNIQFKWLTNNGNKIGHDIYGHILEDVSLANISEKNQVIVAIANPDEQEEIKSNVLHNVPTKKVFYFC
jgi:glycosyltransferase involved in cell wall biosynthesis